VKADGVAPGAGHLALARDPHDKPAGKDAAHVAARQLESFFLRQMLSESRPQGGGMLDGGFAGDTFKQMLDEAIADKMTAAGGIGMTQMFAKQLGKADEVAGAPAPPIANAPIDATRAQPAAVALGDPLTSGAPRFILPVAGRPSSGYGLRADPMRGGEMINHPGFDLAATVGTPVAAAASGTVVHAGPAGTYGNLVTLRHDNGFETRYAHLSSVDVKVGDRVEAGTGLGKVGTTGYSTGPHLHFEVRHDGKAIDPAPLLPLNSSLVRTTR
jgi:murein DD-endopeptidase MepM/ murein hydrolase activator NlpD